MKKLMTATIILLPLLLLAIMLVSGAIVGTMTHVYVESVEFVQTDTLVLVMDDEKRPPAEQLAVNVLPLAAANRNLVFSIEDDEIAAVDENGIVTAKFYGETYVSVMSSENKAARARRKVIVTDSSVHHLVINDDYKADMYQDETQRLSVTVYPREAESSVTWSSSADDVATVSANGTVTAKGAGKAVITATSVDNGEVKASVEITAHKRILDVDFDRTLVVTSFKQSAFPKVTPIPADADVTLEFTTDRPDVATVDAEMNVCFAKEGHVVVTVIATDFGGNSVEKQKEYSSTDGYYLPPLFAQKEYTVDYDEYKQANEFLPIPFAETLEGSYRQFISVNYSVAGVLGFDEATKRFRFDGAMPIGTRSLTVTVKARVYDAESQQITDYEDGFTLTVLRNATDVDVSYKGTNVDLIPISGQTLTFTEEQQIGGSFAVLSVKPANHTNTVVYSLTDGGDAASITRAGVLTFVRPGIVTVKISLLDDDGRERASKEIRVNYTPLGASEKDVEITEKENKIVLMMAAGESDTGVIRFVSPADTDVSYTLTEQNNVIRLDEQNGVWRIYPMSGGFATVKITATAKSGGATQEYFVKVYVDCPVLADDFSVLFNGLPCADVFRTCFDKAAYSVTVADRQGSMAGKQLYVYANGVKEQADEGTLTHSGKIDFSGKNSVTATFGAEYTAEAAAFGAENGLISVSRTVTTSNGTLDSAPTVTYEDGVLQPSENNLVFADIGDEIVLDIVNSFSPSDFDLNIFRPSLEGNDFVGVVISDDGAKITLTARKVCSAQRMTLAIGGKTFTLSVEVRALAEQLEVTCGRVLNGGQRYETLLDELEFTVKTADRADGQPVSNTGVQYSTNGETWDDVNSGKVIVDVSSLTDGILRFRSADKGANVQFFVEKVPLDDVKMEFSVQTSSGKAVIGSVNGIAEESSAYYSLPSDMQGTLTISVTPTKEGLLGIFGGDEDFARMISVELPAPTKWSTSYESSRCEIILSGDFSGVYTEELTVRCGEYVLKVSLSHTYLANVEFTGFDSKNPTDVYRGYQQVRVFAKHSYYDGKTVDYFRIPLVAVDNVVKQTPVDATLLTWKFTRHEEDKAGEVLSSQSGGTVTFGGADYTVVQDNGKYVLKDRDGKIVVGADGKYADGQPRVIWADVCSEPGYARIYFGNFVGLTESDVQNDYFGNFDDKFDWIKPSGEQLIGVTGAEVQPSAGAFSFLRAEAGDGAANGKNCHFNFNVLNDDALVNVFNADGYYANDKVVLQSDLYGEGELAGNDDKLNDAIQKGLLLKDVDGLGKTEIYGNGCQVNLQAKTQSMDKFSESDGITISKAFNTVIKCANPCDVISSQYQKMVLKMSCAYYCGLSYYYKFNPSGNAFYAKNTVFSYVPKAAIQLHNNETLYAENVVIVECGSGILADNSSAIDPHVYFKGNIDVLDYANKSGLENLNPLVGLLFGSVVSNVKDYLEWHGKTFSAHANTTSDPNVEKLYVNVLLFAVGNLSDNVFVWQDGGYKKAEEATLANGSKVVNKNIAFGTYFAWTYETLDDNGVRLDNAVIQAEGASDSVTVTADIGGIFTEKRYIRLLCEYKSSTEKNFDHIQWHMQQVYRDLEIQGLTEGHIDNLINSLKNTSWDDAGVDADGTPYEKSA